MDKENNGNVSGHRNSQGYFRTRHQNRKEKQKYTVEFEPRQSYFTAKESLRKT